MGKRTDNQPLKFTNVKVTAPQTYLGSSTYTRIWAEKIPPAKDSGEDIFEYTKARLIYVLRTKTAIGNTHPLFNLAALPPVDITVQLQYVDTSGKPAKLDDVPYSFQAPHSFLKTKEVLTWDDYRERRIQGKSTAAKGLVHVGQQITDSGKTVKWYVFISQRTTFDDISELNQLETSEVKDVDSGIYISTRGMPTGIRLAPPRSQQAAYWPSFLVLLEYDDLRLDMGRKFIGGRVGQMLTKVALGIFNDHVNAVPRLTTKAADALVGLEMDSALETIKSDAASTPELGFARIPYLKEPVEEQGVIAIFHELVGAGILKGYRTQRSSSYEGYDSYISYKPDLSVIGPSIKKSIKEGTSYNLFAEFKLDAGQSLLIDFETRKRTKDFRLLICWTLNEGVFKANQIDIEPVEPTETIFHGATHKAIFPNSYGFGAENTLHIMALKNLIESLKKSS